MFLFYQSDSLSNHFQSVHSINFTGLPFLNSIVKCTSSNTNKKLSQPKSVTSISFNPSNQADTSGNLELSLRQLRHHLWHLGLPLWQPMPTKKNSTSEDKVKIMTTLGIQWRRYFGLSYDNFQNHQWRRGCYRVWFPLQWRHNEVDGVPNYQPPNCLPNRLFKHRSKKASISSESLAFVRGIHRWQVNSRTKGQ